MRYQNATAYRFLAPYLLIFSIFWLWPIINSFLISFQATRTVPWRFAPTFNWGRLIGDPAFFNALKNTLLNSPLLKARGLFRFAFFAPVVVGEVAYSAVFRLMFNLDYGIINKLLNSIGLPRIDWFSNVTPAMAVIMIAVTWRWAGYNAIILLAGLQSIPQDVYEAATLDRVSKFKQFFYITLPLLKPIIVFCAVLSIIGTMQLFTEPFLIT
ncbi:MAG: sugar ABC transporter permease, partial [Mesorhizobium sp.]